MPELPEVETTLRGIKPYINHQRIKKIIVRHPQLRWPVPENLDKILQGSIVRQVKRRSKYLLISFDQGTLILHLGMSGRLKMINEAVPPAKHDHVDICFTNQLCLRLTDPRRFGALLWSTGDVRKHHLLANIGPEPLTSAFNGDYLLNYAQGRKVPIKSFLMDSKVVAGVGNIYAAEALFLAKIYPYAQAGTLSRTQYHKLAEAVKTVLKKAIKKGGTTLKDFADPTGSPGYFSLELNVYGRGGKPCPRCRSTLILNRSGQRSTVYCPKCQKPN